MKTLGIGRSTLQVLRERNAVYVDKTESIHRLIKAGGGVYFFSRPRRFGKSLLIDALKQLFLGKKELFEGSWIGIEGRHDWASRPVLHIDFSLLSCGNTEQLKIDLILALERTATEYGVVIEGASVKARLVSLIMQLSKQGQVAVLIDEYDAPIIQNILNKELSLDNREVLKEFYTAIKSLDAYVYFIFLTGVSKFAKTSIFSGMNNLKDISMSPEYAALCGYTQQELETCFAPHINQVAQVLRVSREQLLDDMRFWYNGYRFSSAPLKVYNPFSILLFLEEKCFSNFWFETGTPTFLVELIKKRFEEFQEIE